MCLFVGWRGVPSPRSGSTAGLAAAAAAAAALAFWSSFFGVRPISSSASIHRSCVCEFCADEPRMARLLEPAGAAGGRGRPARCFFGRTNTRGTKRTNRFAQLSTHPHTHTVTRPPRPARSDTCVTNVTLLRRPSPDRKITQPENASERRSSLPRDVGVRRAGRVAQDSSATWASHR